MSLALPVFLLGLVALGLPWLLHRFGQQQAEQRDFASDRFLEAVPPPVSQRRRLRHRVLFALRCLALLLLCLLFARPWLPAFDERGAPRTLHAVVLDTSFSMRAVGRFERAVEGLRDALQDIPDGDQVRLYTFAQQLQAVGDEPMSPALARDALASLAPGYAHGDYGQLMRGLDTIAARADLPVAALVGSDLQDSALPARNNDLFAPSLASLRFVDAGGERPVGNVRIDATARTLDRATVRMEVDVQASDLDESVTGTLRIEHGEEVLHSEPVRVSSAQPWRRTIEGVTLPATRVDALTVRFAGQEVDALPEDDLQRIALRRERAFQVTLAGIGARLTERSRVFLDTALQGEGGVEVQRAAGGARRLPDDADLSVVVIDPEDAEALATVEDEVRRGADVMLIPEASRRALSGGTGDEAALDGSGRRIGEIERTHPIDAGRIDWFGVRRYAPTVFTLTDADRVLVSTDDGQPLLIERVLSGSGRLLLLDDPLDGDASNLPFEPAFVELLDAIRNWVDSEGALPERITAGTPLALPGQVQVFDPQGEALLTMQQRSGAERLMLSSPGLYRVVDSRGERVVEVVGDAAESRLATMDVTVRDAWRNRHDGTPDGSETPDVSETGADRDAPAASRSEVKVDQRWLLGALLPFLLLVMAGESLLANRRLDIRRDGS